jgi:hypothetical protein
VIEAAALRLGEASRLVGGGAKPYKTVSFDPFLRDERNAHAVG